MSLLVIGRGGQLASSLVRRAREKGVALDVIGRPEFDLLQPEAIAGEIRARKPSAVINAAAYTAVDAAEDDIYAARQINATGPAIAARAAADTGAAFIQVSTDYVFDGVKQGPYVETDATAPLGVYGATKLEGELQTLAANPNTIVLRTAWVYDATGANFVRTMLRLAVDRDELSVVDDQHGNPTFADDLADAILTIAALPTQSGVFHCANTGAATRAELAEEIFAQSRARGGPTAHVTRVSSDRFPTRAKRPANSRLDTRKLSHTYGIHLRPWREALAACMDEIAVTWSKS